MRLILLCLVLCFSFVFRAGAYNPISSAYFPPPDTVAPPPPPGNANPLTGPSSACVGETSVYSIDVPVACSCQWSVNGILQAGTGSTFSMTWSAAGNQEIAVVLVCAGGQSEPETMMVTVYGIPQPGPISGDELVCEYTYHTYFTTVGPGDSCQWTVNGIIQPGFEPSITYSFGTAGNYHFEVFAFNPCGTSTIEELDVTAQGTAPGTPSPIQGTEESCTGDTDIYTTTVGPGESCTWWIDGIPQSSTTTTLEVTWDERGDHIIEVRAVSECGTGNPAFKNVLVLNQPEVFLGNDTTILQGHSIILDAGNPGSDYLWSTGETTQTIMVNETGIYSVSVFNFCGSDA
ncbi:MAG: hypothetical protein HGA23_07240, partial [Bacteroidales bacterium]|nr:hypothetical protein [Bacteroidales bacterium]